MNSKHEKSLIEEQKETKEQVVEAFKPQNHEKEDTAVEETVNKSTIQLLEKTSTAAENKSDDKPNKSAASRLMTRMNKRMADKQMKLEE